MSRSGDAIEGPSKRASSLFLLAVLGTFGGIVAAISAPHEAPDFALDSIWVYRAEVGLAFLGANYIAGMVLWLAWYGKGFFELGAFGSTLRAPGAEKITEVGIDASGIAQEIGSLQDETQVGLDELSARITVLEDQAADRPDDRLP